MHHVHVIQRLGKTQNYILVDCYIDLLAATFAIRLLRKPQSKAITEPNVLLVVVKLRHNAATVGPPSTI